jgi:hypothetical protein
VSFADLQATDSSEVILPSAVAGENRTLSFTKGCSIFDANVPDLLDSRNVPTSVVQLDVPRTAEGRLALLGGMPGVLAQMQRCNARPDVKTFSLLVDLVPSTRVAENDLLSAMTLQGVRPDVDFFAILIRKRNLRKDYSGARVRDLLIFVPV